jgi:hypothetical protein
MLVRAEPVEIQVGTAFQRTRLREVGVAEEEAVVLQMLQTPIMVQARVAEAWVPMECQTMAQQEPRLHLPVMAKPEVWEDR